jgi:hypothetical protein
MYTRRELKRLCLAECGEYMFGEYMFVTVSLPAKSMARIQGWTEQPVNPKTKFGRADTLSGFYSRGSTLVGLVVLTNVGKVSSGRKPPRTAQFVEKDELGYSWWEGTEAVWKKADLRKRGRVKGFNPKPLNRRNLTKAEIALERDWQMWHSKLTSFVTNPSSVPRCESSDPMFLLQQCLLECSNASKTVHSWFSRNRAHYRFVVKYFYPETLNHFLSGLHSALRIEGTGLKVHWSKPKKASGGNG